jgi:hypothetical protein
VTGLERGDEYGRSTRVTTDGTGRNARLTEFGRP